jgi:hypothetical protein
MEGPEVSLEEMMPKGVKQGAQPDVISPKPVPGELRTIGTSAHRRLYVQVDRFLMAYSATKSQALGQ